MAQQATLQVRTPAIGIVNLAGFVPGHRIDRQVTAAQVLLERDRGRKLEGKAVVAGRRLSFDARQRILLVRLRVQEHGEVLADLLVAKTLKFIHGRSDHDPVPLAHRQSEQFIADCAADQIDLHRLILEPVAALVHASRAGARVIARLARMTGTHGRRYRRQRRIRRAQIATATERFMRAARGALALLALCVSAGCYLTQAAVGQLEINQKRRPIAAVLADPKVSAELKAQLNLIVRLRDFASRSLALPDNQSYRTYADLKRSYVVWNVFATPEFSVAPLKWCFPVAGCVAYRGYFHEAAARNFALELEARGNDVLIGGVPAYSTLGHFADPVLNTMTGWNEAELASLLFHELAHQVVYAKNDSGFNEAFATTVEREGVRRWFADQGDQGALAQLQSRAKRQARVAKLLTDARERGSRTLMPAGPMTRRCGKQSALGLTCCGRTTRRCAPQARSATPMRGCSGRS